MKKRKITRVVLTLLVAAVAWFIKENKLLSNEGVAVPLIEADSDQFTTVSRSGEEWELLKNCRLITGRNNDGDSFHVKHSEGETEFRLYFVDTPESAFKEYRDGNTNGDRLTEQGKYFNGLNQSQTTTVGQAAKKTVKKLLMQQPFDLLTKWENVYGPDRRYAFVIVKWKDEEVYLHELLVAQGLGRIHTRGATLPQGRHWKQQKEFLKKLERQARQQGAGAWGL